MIQIREATLEDAQGLIGHARAVLENSSFTLTTLEEYKATGESQEKWIADMYQQRNLILVAEDQGEIIGDLLFVRGGKIRNSHTGEFAVGVQDKYRGRGIGKRMIQALITWAKSTKEIEKICLQVISGNDAAIALYQKMGFQEEGRLKKQIKLSKGEYADLINMSLFLD
jgi:RimJ/RimL family protein N-acetyltransferase